MEAVLRPSEMRDADEATIAAGTPGVVLMDRAAYACATVALRRFGGGAGRRFVVVCGSGNNGGDGIAAGRHLAAAGASVTVFLIGEPRADAAAHLERARRFGPRSLRIRPWSSGAAGDALARADLALDAVLGSGFSGEPRDAPLEAIGVLESSRAAVVAVDVPSGVSAADGSVPGAAVSAEATVAIQALKVGHVALPGALRCGRIDVADIGIAVGRCDRNVPAVVDVRDVLPRRRQDAHKYSVGALAILAGSAGMTGAAVLACMGAQRAGAGLVALGVPQSVLPVAESAVIEVVKVGLPDDEGQLTAKAVDEFAGRIERSRALAVGPGLGRGPRAVAVVRAVLEKDLPLVIDADGLWALAEILGDQPDVLRERAALTVLTPHAGEFARIASADVSIDAVADAARRLGAVIHRKGPRSVTAAPDGRIWINPTSNASAATAGTGDVLTGVIGALLAQGLEPPDATWAGAFVHGLAADVTASRGGTATAGDLADALVDAMRTVRSSRTTPGSIRTVVDPGGMS